MSSKPLLLKVTRSPKGAYLSVTRLLPKDWSYVLAEVVNLTDTEVMLRLKRVEIEGLAESNEEGSG